MGAELSRIERSQKGAVCVLTLHNPPLNLLTRSLKSHLLASVQEVEREGKTRVLVLTGAGKRAFSAGADIREFPREPGQGLEASHFEHAVFNSLEAFPGPTVAAIQAPALGGGLELALACDFRIASEETRLGFPEIHIGVFASSGATQRLPRIVGEARAKELIFLGKMISAREALEVGLVHRLAPPERVLDEALELAGELADKPVLALRATREAIHFARSASLEEGFVREAELIEKVYLSQDAREGVKAFLEKRKPLFKTTEATDDVT